MNRKRTRFLIPYLMMFAASAHAGSGALGQLIAVAGVDVPAVVVPLPVSAAPQNPAPKLPDEFVIHERVLSLFNNFDLNAGGSKLGSITEKVISLTRAFTYSDAQGVCVAKARARILSWGTHIDVTDCAGRPVGAIKENVLKSLFKVWTEYALLDASGHVVAISEKVDWISTSMTISRPKGGAVATLRRPWLNILSDNWTVKISDHAAVDSRVLVMIAAYKTSVDNARRAESSSGSSSSKNSSVKSSSQP
jgi:uncharacterized protein YxjI